MGVNFDRSMYKRTHYITKHAVEQTRARCSITSSYFSQPDVILSNDLDRALIEAFSQGLAIPWLTPPRGDPKPRLVVPLYDDQRWGMVHAVVGLNEQSKEPLVLLTCLTSEMVEWSTSDKGDWTPITDPNDIPGALRAAWERGKGMLFEGVRATHSVLPPPPPPMLPPPPPTLEDLPLAPVAAVAAPSPAPGVETPEPSFLLTWMEPGGKSSYKIHLESNLQDAVLKLLLLGVAPSSIHLWESLGPIKFEILIPIKRK